MEGLGFDSGYEMSIEWISCKSFKSESCIYSKSSVHPLKFYGDFKSVIRVISIHPVSESQ